MEKIVCVLIFVAFASGAFAAVCQNPRITSTVRSTRDAFFHQSSAFIVEFVVKCSNDAKNLVLYGEVNGRLIPAARSTDSDRYEISWTEEHEKAKSGKYVVNIVDENGYAAIRKAMRNNEEYASKITPLHVAAIEHGGPTKGPWVASETLAALAAAGIFYLAYAWKSAIYS